MKTNRPYDYDREYEVSGRIPNIHLTFQERSWANSPLQAQRFVKIRICESQGFDPEHTYFEFEKPIWTGKRRKLQSEPKTQKTAAVPKKSQMELLHIARRRSCG